MPRKDKASYNEYMKGYMARRYEKRKVAGIKALGGKCACGATENLEFHHIDPSTKLFNLNTSPGRSEKDWKAELAKCKLLCRECHMKQHGAKHGTRAGYRYCKCELCRAAQREYMWRYRKVPR